MKRARDPPEAAAFRELESDGQASRQLSVDLYIVMEFSIVM